MDAMVVLRRVDPLAEEPLLLDAAQQQAVSYRGSLLRVLGAPGTGKTTVAVQLVAGRVHTRVTPAHRCLLLAASRLSAAAVRDRVTAAVAGTTTEPLARTHQAFGFAILRREAALAGEPAPRLITGPEQDAILRELLAGHAAGDRGAPAWPAEFAAALGTRGLRAELRDLLMRAVEHGQEAADLARMGRELDRPEWVAASAVLAEYDEVTALSRPGAYDPAWILTAAADRLEDDPAALSRLRADLDLVVVDDAQEMTYAAARLLQVVARTGVEVVLIGDPDSAVQTFRGADPRFLADGWRALGEGPTIVLPHGYRQPAPLAAVTTRVAGHIGALGGAHQRAPVPAGPEAVTANQPGGTAPALAAAAPVTVAVTRSLSQESALVARWLRQAHLFDRVPWSQMAVVVRGRARMQSLRRALAGAGVPVRLGDPSVPLRDEPAARALLDLARVVAQRHRDGQLLPEPDEVVDLLTSPIGGTDPVALRRLRRALRAEERGSGGTRTSDQLLPVALLDPQWSVALGPDGAGLRRLQRAVAAGQAALDAGTVAVDEVLWALWQGLGLAAGWRDAALAGGAVGERADRDLDAVVALFDAACGFVDRLPLAGVREFVDHVAGQEVAADTLVARAVRQDVVEILTPVSAAGRQWPLVAVCGVQDGQWPDLRLRGSLLGSEQLVDLLTARPTDPRAARAAVRYDETRLFHVAVSRASRAMLVTAVRSEDEQPSPYLDVVDPPVAGGPAGEDPREFTDVAPDLTLPAVVAQLRRRLVTAGGRDDEAARLLADLTARGVAGADPGRWWPLLAPTDDRPVVPDDRPVTVSPSQVDQVQRCAFQWLLTTRGGSRPGGGPQSLGTLIHDLAHDLGPVDEATYREELERRWPTLGLPRSWASTVQFELAVAMVGRLAGYLASLPTDGWQEVGTELGLSTEVGRAVITGRVDRLERRADTGALRVVDLKTGAHRPTAPELARHGQLGAYQVAVSEGAFAGESRDSAGAALVQLGKAAGRTGATIQSQPGLAQDPDPRWAHELVETAARTMSADRFAATVGTHCRGCPVRASCPVQPEGERL